MSADNNGEVTCTSLDRDWGDERPNLLMHPPCLCPRCAPDEIVNDETDWLVLAGTSQRFRVEAAKLGATGQAFLGYELLTPQGSQQFDATIYDAPMTALAESFVADGYLIVPELVSATDRQRIADDAQRFISGHYPVSNMPDDGDVLAVHFPHWVSDTALDMVRHEGIVDVLSQITGAHLPEWDGATKCMQSMLFFKPPGLQGQAWHQDERFIPTRDRSLVGAWIAVDDASIDNGCLWVLPGSHRTGQLWPTQDHGKPELFDPTDESYGFDDSDAVPVEVAAGSVVFFNGYLLHRSLPNNSDRRRMALVNHYMNAWSPLPWMMEKGIDVGTSDYRTVVQTSGTDPYAWRGIAAPPSQTFVRPNAGAANADDVRAKLEER